MEQVGVFARVYIMIVYIVMVYVMEIKIWKRRRRFEYGNRRKIGENESAKGKIS
jgi:hypothetical protein